MSDEKFLEAENFLSVPRIQRCHRHIHLLWMEHRFVNFELLLFHFTHTFQRKTRNDILQRDLLDLSFCWYEILGTRYPVISTLGMGQKKFGLGRILGSCQALFWTSQVWYEQNPPERILFIFWTSSQEDFALKSRLRSGGFLEHRLGHFFLSWNKGQLCAAVTRILRLSTPLCHTYSEPSGHEDSQDTTIFLYHTY